VTAGSRREAFEALGFAGPIRVFDEDEAGRIRALLEAAPAPPDWFKGRAVTSAAWFATASHPRIVDAVAELLGDDVMLWGASLVRRRPGIVHPWHTDIETSADLPGSVTVWIGLEHTSRESALQWIPRSHTFGLTIQERARRAGAARARVVTDDVARWAAEIDPRCAPMRLDLRDGEAMLFDGRLWHASHNTGSRTRTALLLQYATPDRAIRIPDPAILDHPFRWLDRPWPPCVIVRGRARGASNRIVPAPSPAGATTSWVRSLRVPLAPAAGTEEAPGWTSSGLARGATHCVQYLAVHASTLGPGATPHEPHEHRDEELLVMLDGAAELALVDGRGDQRRETARPGTVAYYPAGQRHTIMNPSAGPASYLMFKWWNDRRGPDAARLAAGVFRFDDLLRRTDPGEGEPWAVRRLFEGATEHLSKLRCHVSTLQPGAGYAPHTDLHEVALVVFQGTVETPGGRVGPHGVVFHGAGEPHGIRNVGTGPAVYLAIEFHAPMKGASLASLRWRLAAEMRRQLRDRLPRPVRQVLRRMRGRQARA
jgi:mannose-6-phosphate isomerase-like protein (cupin superfamily)